MIRHHPSEATLVARASGTLPELHARVLAVHLAACAHCRRELRFMEEIGGALLTSLDPVGLNDGALQRTLARLDEIQPARPLSEHPPSVYATQAPAVTLEALATGRWWWIGPGIRLMPLRRRDAFDTRLDLIRVAPGVAMPGHGHTGREMACILQGSYLDDTGEYGLHDIAEGDRELAHTPVAMPGPDCICLIATTGRLRGHSWLARLVQPLIGV
jgi:putative transcriptional regulator